MTISGLIVKIKWQESVEFVPLSLTAESDKGFIDTYEIWDSKERIEYRARYKRTINTDGTYRFDLDYRSDNNALREKWPDIDLGQSRIDIMRNMKDGRAFWTSSTQPEIWDGPSKNCEILLAPFLDDEREIHRENRLVISRPGQTMLRAMLLAIDGCCAITKEKTHAALEAAHINGVADRGTDAVGNGILLRADLHRLYDRGVFDILPNGNIVLGPNLSAEYRELLKKSKIDSRIIARIHQNLEKRRLQNEI